METLSIIVSGKVQGVWFRQSTKEKAMELGISGEVSNQPDGTVTIIATGRKEQLSIFTDWCKIGPPKAKVENTSTTVVAYKKFTNFTIVR